MKVVTFPINLHTINCHKRNLNKRVLCGGDFLTPKVVSSLQEVPAILNQPAANTMGADCILMTLDTSVVLVLYTPVAVGN